MIDEIKTLMLLEAFRVKGNSVPYPVHDNWGYLEEPIDGLIEDGLLEVIDNNVTISMDGKKSLLMFDSERKDLLLSLEVYKEVVTNSGQLDARLAVSAFQTRKMKPELQVPHLEMVAIAIYWDEFFSIIKGLSTSVLWQKVLFSAFDKHIKELADRYSWRKLGQTVDEAVLNCERLVNPIPSRKLVQITYE